MKVGQNVPKTLVDLCRRDTRVVEVCNEGGCNTDTVNDYWLTLADGWEWSGCGSVHESTVEDCRKALKDVKHPD